MRGNPFLGPQPYRGGDRERFFGRHEVTRHLANRILAHPCVTLFGPSGAGKSSLMQAGVIPLLEATHDCRVVHIEGWLREEPPLERLVRALFRLLELGPFPESASLSQALALALDLAEQQSDRPLLIYLDQFEQLFQHGRDAGRTEEFLEGLQELARSPLRGLQLVIALREDYLGRYRDWARGRRELLDQGFRLGPLTVGEMVKVACQLAETGTPAQQWPQEELMELMLQVRMAGQDNMEEAEVQAAFAQIVCRALWEERSTGRATGVVRAEPMLHQYLETTLNGLGALKTHARRLLEEHLVAGDGSRTLLMEKQARAVLSELSEQEASMVLTRLEATAVLHAEEHQGSRYFELGHDWLARKVFERKQERLLKEQEDQRRQEEKARQEEETRKLQEKQARREEEAARKLLEERTARRKLALVAGGSLVVAVLTGTLGVLLLKTSIESQELQDEAKEMRAKVREHVLVSIARSRMELSDPVVASKLLLAIEPLENKTAWMQVALDLLVRSTIPTATLSCSGNATQATFSPKGEHIALACADGTAWKWQANGKGRPVELRGHEGSVLSASFSPKDGQLIVTASADKTARVWKADGTGVPLVLRGHEGSVRSASFSPDGQFIVTASADKTMRVWKADGTGEPLVPRRHGDSVLSASFSPDGRFIVTASADKTVRVWKADGTGEPLELRGHEDSVLSASFSPDGQDIVTASADKTARMWKADGTGEPLVLRGHQSVVSASFSQNGRHIVTISLDGKARVWEMAGTGELVEEWRHDGGIVSAAFSPDGQDIVTFSNDKKVRVWKLGEREKPHAQVDLRDSIASASFSPDGQLIVTALENGKTLVWKLGEKARPVMLSSLPSGIVSASLSRDGQRLVTLLKGGKAGVWKLDEKAVPLHLQELPGRFVSASLSMDGQFIVTTSENETAQVWKVGEERALVTLRGHEGSVTSASFSPDGQFIVTASEDRTARVWKADGTGLPLVLRELKGVISASFNNDLARQRIVTVSRDGRARVWPLTVKELQSLLSQANSDCLSPEERLSYLDEDKVQAQKGYDDCEQFNGRLPLAGSP